jgi:hypothetical protein
MARTVSARTLTSKRAVLGELAHHGSGYVLSAAIGAGAVLRARRGRLGPRDAAAVLAVAAAQPFVEWALHRHVLHGRGISVAGRRIDPGAPHRGHHRAPDDVAGALLGGGYAVADAAGVGVLAAAIGGAVGGPAGACTAIAAGEAGLLAYEWTHLLAHSGYRPRSRWARAVRANHLRHHFRDERRGFGVTSTLGDRVFGTRAA